MVNLKQFGSLTWLILIVIP